MVLKQFGQCAANWLALESLEGSTFVCMDVFTTAYHLSRKFRHTKGLRKDCCLEAPTFTDHPTLQIKQSGTSRPIEQRSRGEESPWAGGPSGRGVHFCVDPGSGARQEAERCADVAGWDEPA